MNIKEFWHKVSNNGISSNDSFEDTKRVRILNQFAIVGSIISMLYVVPLSFSKEPYLALFDFDIVVIGVVVLVLIRKKLYQTAAILMFVCVPAALTLINFKYGRVGSEYFYFSLFILLYYIFNNKLILLLLGVYMAFMFGVSKYFEITIIPTGIAAEIAPSAYYINIAFTFLTAWHFLTLFVREHKTYQLEVENKNIQLEKAIVESVKKNEEVKILMKELNHRTKNNLQLISSLFNIQSYKTKNKETKNALNDARNRIVSIAIMHQKLYKDNLSQKVNLKKYVDDLLNYLIHSVSTTKPVDVQVYADEVMLLIEDTVHVGLLINELVTNAIKYGTTAKNDRNEIHISIRYNEGILTIEVSDNGNGFPENFDIKASDSFGMELINSIVNQHEGKIEIKNEKGAKVNVELKITEFRD